MESNFDRVKREFILIFRKPRFLSGLDQVKWIGACIKKSSIVWLAVVLMNGRPRTERGIHQARGLFDLPLQS